MSWKKVADSRDLVVLEKEGPDGKLKIEARRSEKYGWEVFKLRVKGDQSSLISEHMLDTREEVDRLIARLMESRRQGRERQVSGELRLSLRRAYKEEYIEKWFFQVAGTKVQNFLVVRYDNPIQMDIVLHESLRHFEKGILQMVEDKLGLRGLGDGLVTDVYYFRKQFRSSAEYGAGPFEYTFTFGGTDPEEEEQP